MRGQVHAVSDVSFQLWKGETYGLVGESGCGKSTTGRTLLRLVEPTRGEAMFESRDVFTLNSKELRGLRKKIQMIFQDPYSSLNPRRRVGSTLEEAMSIHHMLDAAGRRDRAFQLLERVGFSKEHYYRFPHEFSGGQRQRIGIARALSISPELIVCDEPVSALDVSIQAQVVNMLRELQRELGLTYLFISHDLSVVRYISDRVGVMYLGELVEEAATENLYAEAKHPYTQALLSAVPIPQLRRRRERIVLSGEVPSAVNPPNGCKFHTRCPLAMPKCSTEVPVRKAVSEGHFVACHLYE
jgi:peptide/nickel transport system ATP-binding protein/oligopeptide transport system ATP-binding protein